MQPPSLEDLVYGKGWQGWRLAFVALSQAPEANSPVGPHRVGRPVSRLTVLEG